MKKILFFLPALFFSANTFSQTNDQYMSLFNKIDELVNNYVEYSTLNTVDQSKITPASVSRFIGLFTSENAMVDYDARIFRPEVTFHEAACLPVKEYCKEIADRYPMGLKSVQLIKSDIDYKPLGAENKVRVVLEKKMSGVRKDNKLVEIDHITIMMTLAVSGDMSSVKIDSIIIVDPHISGRVGMVTSDEEILPSQVHTRATKAKSTEHKLFVSLDLKAGTESQSVPAIAFTSLNYHSIPGNTTTIYSAPHFSSGSSIGFDGQLEYYFGRKANIGIGAGIAYFSQKGTMQMDNFHVEYQATDTIENSNSNNTYRQVINAKAISEQLTITNIDIPILLKFKARLSDKWGFAADAGVLFNLSITNSYTTNALFDYSAYYAFTGNNESPKASFDNQAPPGVNDWLIAAPYYSPTQLDAMASRGYNVGAAKAPTATTGSVSYASGSIGFLIQPALTYKISKGFLLDLGVYYMSQTFSNTAHNAGYEITNKVGSYNSMLNSLSGLTSSGFGVNIGVKIAII